MHTFARNRLPTRPSALAPLLLLLLLLLLPRWPADDPHARRRLPLGVCRQSPAISSMSSKAEAGQHVCMCMRRSSRWRVCVNRYCQHRCLKVSTTLCGALSFSLCLCLCLSLARARARKHTHRPQDSSNCQACAGLCPLACARGRGAQTGNLAKLLPQRRVIGNNSKDTHQIILKSPHCDLRVWVTNTRGAGLRAHKRCVGTGLESLWCLPQSGSSVSFRSGSGFGFR